MKKTLKQAMVDKKYDKKEAQELKRIYNHYLDKRKDIMKNTQFKVEDVFGDVLSKDNFSQEQETKINNFLAKILWIWKIINIKFNFFKPKKTNNIDILPSAAPCKMNKSFCI